MPLPFLPFLGIPGVWFLRQLCAASALMPLTPLYHPDLNARPVDAVDPIRSSPNLLNPASFFPGATDTAQVDRSSMSFAVDTVVQHPWAHAIDYDVSIDSDLVDLPASFFCGANDDAVVNTSVCCCFVIIGRQA